MYNMVQTAEVVNWSSYELSLMKCAFNNVLCGVFKVNFNLRSFLSGYCETLVKAYVSYLRYDPSWNTVLLFGLQSAHRFDLLG